MCLVSAIKLIMALSACSLARMMFSRKSEIICKFLVRIYLIQRLSGLKGAMEIHKMRNLRESKSWPAQVHPISEIKSQAFWCQEQSSTWSRFHWPNYKVVTNLLEWSGGNLRASHIAIVHKFPSTLFLWPYKPINCSFSGSLMIQHT